MKKRVPTSRDGLRSIAAVVLLLTCVFAVQRVAAQMPEEVVKDTTSRLLSAIKAERATIEKNPARIRQLVNEIILPVVDVNSVARLVLGKYWRQATPEQRERFIKEFKTLLVRTYSGPLVNYANVKIDYLPSQSIRRNDDATVRTRINTETGKALSVDYRLHRRNGQWLVYDVTVDGVSTLVTFRNSYNDQINRLGLDAFLDELAKKNKEFSSGQLTPLSTSRSGHRLAYRGCSPPLA